jgi:hypothetical protein
MPTRTIPPSNDGIGIPTCLMVKSTVRIGPPEVRTVRRFRRAGNITTVERRVTNFELAAAY